MDNDKALTGVPGLDDILLGGLSRGNVFLLEGEPGTGKTTVSLQFLLEGSKRGRSRSTSRSRKLKRSFAGVHRPTVGRWEAKSLCSNLFRRKVS